MKYQQSNGHTDALAEPNSTSSVSIPVIKKPKRTSPEREEKKDPLTEDYYATTEQEDMRAALMEDEMEMGVDDTAAALPIIPIPIIKTKVYGLYGGQLGNLELALREDIDGATS